MVLCYAQGTPIFFLLFCLNLFRICVFVLLMFLSQKLFSTWSGNLYIFQILFIFFVVRSCYFYLLMQGFWRSCYHRVLMTFFLFFVPSPDSCLACLYCYVYCILYRLSRLYLMLLSSVVLIIFFLPVCFWVLLIYLLIYLFFQRSLLSFNVTKIDLFLSTEYLPIFLI